MGPEEVRLIEIDAQAAVERRPPRVRAGRARAAQEIQMVVLAVDAALFFGAVADAEVHPLMIAFGDGNAGRHFARMLLLVERLHVGELKQLQPV